MNVEELRREIVPPLLKRVGTIVEGAEIICNYTIDDAGSIKLEVEIPAVGEELLQAVGEVASTAISANNSTHDAEELKHIEENLQAAKKTLADIRARNKFAIRQDDFDGLRGYYEKYLKKFATPQEVEEIEKLFERAETLIERDDSTFDDTVREISDSFVADTFNRLIKNPDDFTDREKFYRLAQSGKNAIAQKNFVELRKIVDALYSIRIYKGDEFLSANIIRA